MRAAQQLALIEPVAQKAVTTSYTATFTLPKQGAALYIIGVNRPLTGRDALTTMEGEDYDGQSNGTKEDSGDTSMGQSVSVTAGGSLFFNNVDFTDQGVGSVDLRVKATAATTIEMHADTATGPLVGTCAIAAATSWATQTCKLTQTTGVHTLYLNFTGAVHLNWLKFSQVACTGTSCTSGTGGASSVGTGGSSTAGGSGSTGGTKTNGGTSGATGGTVSTSAGGKSATGGTATAGGAPATGGSGVASIGGATAGVGGGSPGVGGGNPTGGAGVSVGGNAPNAGGAPATGGVAANAGGAAAIGGAPAVGGAGAIAGSSSGNTSPSATDAGKSDSGGCGCRVPAHQTSPLGTTGRLALLGLVGFGLWRRKRAQS
jgi:MYXO-CTERM domain-containing protein